MRVHGTYVTWVVTDIHLNLDHKYQPKCRISIPYMGPTVDGRNPAPPATSHDLTSRFVAEEGNPLISVKSSLMTYFIIWPDILFRYDRSLSRNKILCHGTFVKKITPLLSRWLVDGASGHQLSPHCSRCFRSWTLRCRPQRRQNHRCFFWMLVQHLEQWRRGAACFWWEGMVRK